MYDTFYQTKQLRLGIFLKRLKPMLCVYIDLSAAQRPNIDKVII